MSAAQAWVGSLLHTPDRGAVELLSNHLVVVAGDGRISAVQPATPSAILPFAAAGRLTQLTPDQLLLPGLIDLHIHAPQWPQRGKALDQPLPDWLQHSTFPLEARYADLDYAGQVYTELVDALLAHGTTTAVYYATLHLPATQRLAEICLRRGQRALIGRVAMDDAGQCPDFYRDSSAAVAAAETGAFIDFVRALPGNAMGRILPVITPRFIPACSDDLLQRLGRLAAETGCHVQTHCSESDWEQDFVLNRCGVSDSAALAGFGLLSRHTVLAHAVFLSDADRALIKAAGAAIAHCPLSNAYFADAVFPLRQALNAGLHVGLGSDVAGGASPSMLGSARQAVVASRCLESGVDARLPADRRGRPGARIDAREAFWLTTAGGGLALDLPIGLFREGYQFDALLIDLAAPHNDIQRDKADTPADILDKIVYLGGRHDVQRVWVAGREVHRQ